MLLLLIIQKEVECKGTCFKIINTSFGLEEGTKCKYTRIGGFGVKI
ncbi:hypothetical protein HBZC1_05050 [Helicobacter bizzozeronii CIII-1]|uniref:Uncharacterized protein n=1 Tax=Helicobacter bizzozeronii (strain CIII-1) TaxID=1002804 RepID=F8KRU7_HELBC|nr:hypothetical protein HBZC1_05050 [Helicobacter bizzozeronii CIII-1]